MSSRVITPPLYEFYLGFGGVVLVTSSGVIGGSMWGFTISRKRGPAFYIIGSSRMLMSSALFVIPRLARRVLTTAGCAAGSPKGSTAARTCERRMAPATARSCEQTVKGTRSHKRTVHYQEHSHSQPHSKEQAALARGGSTAEATALT